jgi:photosystem II protein
LQNVSSQPCLQAETGKENVDEYSPIFTPEKWSTTGDTYAPGLAGIALWAVTFTTIIGGAAYLVINTSALGA